MKHSIKPTKALFFILAVLATAITACSGISVKDAYQTGATEIRLWRNERIPLAPHWRYLGTERMTVRGEYWNSHLTPTDRVETLVFAKEGIDGGSFLLASRVVKTGTIDIFRFLGGNKTDLEGVAYREAHYGLDANSTDPEYQRYLNVLSTAGFTLAPHYAVRVLDRLPLDTVLVRIMELTPGHATLPLPAYGRLYQQERLERSESKDVIVKP